MPREEIFKTRLRGLRHDKRASSREVAEGLGITDVAYRNYEAGRRKPNFDVLPAIADFFDVSTDYLLGRSNNPARVP